MSSQQAVTASSLLNTLGINTHIDFNAYGYENLGNVEAALNYLGVQNVRDSAQNTSDLSAWQQVSQATGVKFDDYMPEGSPADMQNALGLVNQLASEGVLNLIEGGNEEDNDYALAQGNSIAYTASFQQQVHALGQSLGLGVINMSFGSGWTYTNDWHGDYDKVGDLSGVADYANAHTYPNPGQATADSMAQLNADALLAAGSRPVITTEMGWDNNTFSQSATAQYVVQAALDGMVQGDVRTYFYSLYDDGSGAFGLMHADGSAKPAGAALHNLTTLLADSGAGFTPGSLDYTLGGTQGGDNTLLMQKSDGSDWLAVWNETAGVHTVTLNLANAASQIAVFDPVTGTGAIAAASNTGSISFALGNDPLLVKVVPAGGAAVPVASGPVAPVASGPVASGPVASGPVAPAPGAPVGSSPDPVLTVPASVTASAGSSVAITGVSVADPWAAGHDGHLALNVTSTGGTVAMRDAAGAAVGGSGTAAINVGGSLAEVNAMLATLAFAGAAGNGSITVDVWDQGGVEATKSIGVTVAGGTAAPSLPVAPVPVGATDASAPNPVLSAPAGVNATAGQTISLGGVSLADAWAGNQGGTLALNVTTAGGAIAMRDAGGNAVAGSGSSAIHVSGTLSQINAELATLSYTAGGANDSVTIDVWDQGGVEATRSVGVTVGGGAAGAGTPTPAPTAPTGTTQTGTTQSITIAADDASPVELVDNASISASAGDHMIFIGGTGNAVTATGGTETIQAYQGGNALTAGASDDTLRFAGANNSVDAGGGNNLLFDSGTNNTIVLPGASQGYDDIYGYTMTNGDMFDMRAMLSGTGWNGDLAGIGNFVSVAASGNDAVISVNPSGTAGGSYAVATLEGTGPVSLGTLLSHAIT